MVSVLVATTFNHTFPQTLCSLANLDGADDALWHYSPNADKECTTQAEMRGRRYIIDTFLNGEWSHILWVDGDMIVPPYAVGALLDCKAPIAYGLYCWRYRKHRWNAQMGHTRNYEPENHLSDNPAQARELWGTVFDCNGKGFGCTLIEREVIERAPFKMRGRHAGDHVVATWANTHRIPQKCHAGVICGHIMRDKHGRVTGTVWPSNNGSLHRIEAA